VLAGQIAGPGYFPGDQPEGRGGNGFILVSHFLRAPVGLLGPVLKIISAQITIFHLKIPKQNIARFLERSQRRPPGAERPAEKVACGNLPREPE
jgi:hypothetical protein